MPNNKKAKSKQKTNEDIIAGFQNLRLEQRGLASKLSEMELDLHEHKIVIETLKGVEGDRKCFRMVGGILCQQTVKDVLPVLKSTKQQMKKMIISFKEQLTEMGKELSAYKEKYSIVVNAPPLGEVEEELKPQSGSHVLV